MENCATPLEISNNLTLIIHSNTVIKIKQDIQFIEVIIGNVVRAVEEENKIVDQKNSKVSTINILLDFY